MSLLPRTLTSRLVLTVIALAAAVGLLLALSTTFALNRYLNHQLDDEVHSALSRVVEPRGQFDPSTSASPPPLQTPGTLISFPEGGTFLMPEGTRRIRPVALIVGNDGETPTLGAATVRRLAAVPVDGGGHTLDTKRGEYRVMADENANGDRVVVGLRTQETAAATRSLLWTALLLAVLATMLAGLAAAAVVRRQLRPLRMVSATAHEVTTQELSTGDTSIGTRVPSNLTDPDTEVGQVGAALNTLLDHVDDALASRHRSEQRVRQFVADASHELRTPLSTIHGYAELSRRTPDDPGSLSHAMEKVETEATRMAALVDDLLLLARLDSGRPLERKPVDLTRLLLEAVADARVVAPDHQWRLALPDEPVEVTGDAGRLHQVITNLLNNARRHTPPGTTVTVSAQAGDPAQVAVHDDGPGLAPELAGTAFERFTRGDSSRTRASGGAGLGLSLVAAIVGAHSGQVSVTSAPRRHDVPGQPAGMIPAARAGSAYAAARLATVSWALSPDGFGTTQSSAPARSRSWRPATAFRSPNAARYAVIPAMATTAGRCFPDERLEPLATLAELRGVELVCSRSRPRHQVGDAQPPGHEGLPVLIGHAGRRVDGVLDDARSQQRRIEPVDRVREVGLHGSGPQARVDPDEEQLQPGADEVGDLHAAIGGQLRLGEPHCLSRPG